MMHLGITITCLEYKNLDMAFEEASKLESDGAISSIELSMVRFLPSPGVWPWGI